MAAHLHDSVLQTLALIQKNADDPADGGPAGPRPGARPAGLAVRRRATDERSRGLRAALARRGRGGGRLRRGGRRGESSATARLDEAVWPPSCSATREAMTNAAKHAGTGRVDVYAEVIGDARWRSSCATAARASTPTACPSDRLRRAGTASSTGWSGTAARARIRSAPGEGTEVAAAELARTGPTETSEPRSEPAMSERAGPRRHRRRPRDVPPRRARRAGRRRRRGGRGGRRRRGGRRGAAEQPDVVLLDVHLPGGGGVEVMRAGAGSGPTRALPRAVGQRRRRGRHRHHPRRRPRLRHQDHHRPRAGRGDPAGRRRRRGVLAAAGRASCWTPSPARSRSRPSTRTSTGSPSASGR